jgi:hypothetical protein
LSSAARPCRPSPDIAPTYSGEFPDVARVHGWDR